MGKDFVLKEQLQALVRAMRGLEVGQGDRARKNARRRVALALASVRRAMDREFPAPKKQQRKLSQDPVAKEARWRKQGWHEANLGSTALAALAGVRARASAPDGRRHFLPNWLLAFKDNNAAGLRRAKTDLEYRKAMLVAWRTTGERQ